MTMFHSKLLNYQRVNLHGDPWFNQLRKFPQVTVKSQVVRITQFLIRNIKHVKTMLKPCLILFVCESEILFDTVCESEILFDT